MLVVVRPHPPYEIQVDLNFLPTGDFQLAGVMVFDPSERNYIQLGKAHCDDGFVPDEMIAAFEDAMRRSGTRWTFVSYGGAVHSFTNPAADGRGIPGVKYDERADRQSWDHMAAFFGRLLDRRRW